ncbi:CAP domain-containing protein [Candidatus Parcubacteria bacterium]|nr:CAP domain-containing protein [Candidatus Parcubacteria bacterium]
MIRWLKEHFVPHKGNYHRPQFLEWGTVKYAVAAVVLIELVLFLLPTAHFASFIDKLNLSAVLPGALSTLTNDARAANDAPILAENVLLDRAAALKAEDMAGKGYFAHTSPEGRTPWYWFNLVGYQYSYAGENLAVNFSDSADVTQAWMNSPTHKANIISRNYREIGTGVATGTYKGSPAVFVAQLFGTPRSLAAVSGASPVPAWEMFLVSPHQSVNLILLALLALTAIALIVVISMPRSRHPDLIIHGLFLAAFIVGVYVANDYLSHRNFETSFIALDPQGEVQ